MTSALYVSSAVAILATLLAVTRTSIIHALAYLAVSLLAVAVVFFLIGAELAAALEVVVGAGAIIALFVFAVTSMNPGREPAELERTWLTPGTWLGPSALAALLLAEFGYLLTHEGLTAMAGSAATGPREVGLALWGRYLIGIALAFMVLPGGLVTAYHIGWRRTARAEGGDDRRSAD